MIDGATSVKVADVGTGRTYPATAVGYDQSGDIAVLQAQGASGLKAAKLGIDSKVTVGEAVVLGTMPGLPAAKAGLAPGDAIVSVTGHAVASPSGTQALLEPYHPGD